MSIIHRAVSKNILEALAHMPVVFVNGPRQAGKSTLVQALSKKSWPATYITFDEPTQLGAAQANPATFLRGYTKPLIIDEVQMVPDLFRALKMIVDDMRLQGADNPNGQYLLTGSANIMALPALADALVGRMAIITLYPLSALEMARGKGSFLVTLFKNGFRSQGREDTDDLIAVMHRATFPEITDQDDKSRRQWFESYIMTILQRDLRQIANVEKLGILPNLLRILASRAGGLINEADIARSISQNAVTTKTYRHLLNMMFLTFDVRPWFKHIGKRLVKSPKGYITDTSLLCHLQQVSLQNIAARDPYLFGHVLENFVATEFLKQLTHFDRQTDLLHFRTSDNKEVDFVLQRWDGKLAGVEVKAAENVNSNDFKGLKELQNQNGENFVSGAVLYRGKSTIAFGDKLWAVPISELWN